QRAVPDPGGTGPGGPIVRRANSAPAGRGRRPAGPGAEAVGWAGGNAGPRHPDDRASWPSGLICTVSGTGNPADAAAAHLLVPPAVGQRRLPHAWVRPPPAYPRLADRCRRASRGAPGALRPRPPPTRPAGDPDLRGAVSPGAPGPAGPTADLPWGLAAA